MATTKKAARAATDYTTNVWYNEYDGTWGAAWSPPDDDVPISLGSFPSEKDAKRGVEDALDRHRHAANTEGDDWKNKLTQPTSVDAVAPENKQAFLETGQDPSKVE